MSRSVTEPSFSYKAIKRNIQSIFTIRNAFNEGELIKDGGTEMERGREIERKERKEQEKK